MEAKLLSEEWRCVPLEGYRKYAISNFGAVRNQKTGRTLSPHIHYSASGKAYFRVTLHNRGVKRNWLLHRLVAVAWLELPDQWRDMPVMHADANGLNCRLDNLSWGSHSENVKQTWEVRRAKDYPIPSNPDPAPF